MYFFVVLCGYVGTTIYYSNGIGNAYDIVFNITKSQVMFYDTLKIGQAANIMLGDTVLSVTQTYMYLGHIITNNLSDEADMEDKMRGLYARSNMLRRKFYFCSDQVKNKLFSAYCKNIYIYVFAMGLLSKEMHAPVCCIL